MECLPQISVIVPVYNAETYLRRCIDSIIAQTFIDFEVLLIDDGSIDNSGKICDEYASRDTRIMVFHKENGGVSSARNLGLENSRGEWISFVDADDWVEQSFFQAFMDNTSVQTGDLFIQGFIFDINQTHVFWINQSVRLERGVENLLSKPMRGAVWNKLFKSSIIKEWQVRFDIRLSFLEDECFVLDYLLHCSSLCFIEGCKYHYIEPTWDTKYDINNIFSRESCLNRAIKLGTVSNTDMSVYITKYFDAVVESVLKNMITKEQYRQSMAIIGGYSVDLKGKLNYVASHCPIWISYNYLRLIGFIRHEREKK